VSRVLGEGGKQSHSMLLSPSFWWACRKALGATKRRSPGELIDQLGHGDLAEDTHADDSPDQALHVHTATAQGRMSSTPSCVMMSSGGMRSESDSNWAALLAWRKSRAWSIRIKNPKPNQQVSDFYTSGGAVNGSLTDRH